MCLKATGGGMPPWTVAARDMRLTPPAERLVGFNKLPTRKFVIGFDMRCAKRSRNH